MISIGDRISIAVTKFYESISQNGKPNAQNLEFTVLAAIVACNSESNEINVLSLATGTKCAGKGDIGTSGCILRDCHAEVVARRAFIRFLLKCVHIYIEHSAEQQEKSLGIFEASLDPAFLLQIKSKWHIWLYVSDSPCGDASIYSRQFGRSFSGMKAPSVNSSDFAPSHESVTSTKPTNFNDHNNNINKFENISNKTSDGNSVLPVPQLEIRLGDVRLKPGRQDMKMELRSESMSCSDKVARWTVLGLQGGLLSNMIAPILLKGIVIGRDALALPGAQRGAAVRAFHHRLSRNTDCYQQDHTDNSSSGSSSNSSSSNSSSSNSNSSTDRLGILNHHNSQVNTESYVSTDTATDTTSNNPELVENGTLPVIIISREAFCSGKCSVEHRSLLAHGTVEAADATGNNNSSLKRKRTNIDIKFPAESDRERDSKNKEMADPLMTDSLGRNYHEGYDPATESISDELHVMKTSLLSFPPPLTSTNNIAALVDTSDMEGKVPAASLLAVTISTSYDDSKDSKSNKNNMDYSESCVPNDCVEPAVAAARKLETESSLTGNERIDTTASPSPCPCPAHHDPPPRLLPPPLPLRSIQVVAEETAVGSSGWWLDISPLARPPSPCGYCINWVRDVDEGGEAASSVVTSTTGTGTGTTASSSRSLIQSSATNTNTNANTSTTTDPVERSLKHIKSCIYLGSSTEDGGGGGRGTVEVLSSRNGLRQGAGKPKNGDFSRICSRLCKRETALLMIRILRGKVAQKFPLLVSILKKIDHCGTSEETAMTASATIPAASPFPPSAAAALAPASLPRKVEVSYHRLKLLCEGYRQRRAAFLSDRQSPFHRWNVADPRSAEGFTVTF